MNNEIVIIRVKNGFILRPNDCDPRCSHTEKTEVADTPDAIAKLVRKWALGSEVEYLSEKQMPPKEVMITFKGQIGSGKSILQRVTMRAIKEAGHTITGYGYEDHTLRVEINFGALPFEPPLRPDELE